MLANLDALIPREDFEVDEREISSQPLPAIQVRDLEESSFFYKTLRKPDFQRETSEWSPDKINDLVKSFLEGDLIPAVILWSSGGYNFVIDGAHRMSALISWISDDYGDGVVSKSFFEHNLSDDQLEIADKTRKLIKKTIGTYKDHIYAINNPSKVEPRLLSNAQKLATLTVQLQWVRGDASKAEASFFKINEQPAPVNDTEKRLLKSRKKPNSIAARAIMRAGTGHKYWSKFSQEIQDQIEALSKEINEILFAPKLKTPIKTLDVPLAGKGYSSQTLALVLDMINIVNDTKQDSILINDDTGEETIKYLKRTKSILSKISSNKAGSLGLHPAVYFYSGAGRYQITAFLAILELIRDFDNRNIFPYFIKNRERFESFLLKYKSIINQINLKHGSGLKSYKRLYKIFTQIIEKLNRGEDHKVILEFLKEEYPYLNPEEIDVVNTRSTFSTDSKSATFLRDALSSAVRCKICHAYIHVNSISIDHKLRKQDGGKGTVENGQLTHPYCNNSIKN